MAIPIVPLNGAFGRLLCRFGAILFIFCLIFWTVSQRRKLTNQVDILEDRLQFAQQQLSSLHAQIDVITRHKEKIESLLKSERDDFQRLKIEQIQRILHLESENNRLGNALIIVNRTTPKVSQQELPGLKSLLKPMQSGNQEFGQPIAEPMKQKLQSEDQQQLKEEDPFENKEVHDGHQIKAPMVQKEFNEAAKTDKEPNGGEKMSEGEDYVFKRPKPRDDLIFHRTDGNGSETGGVLLSNRELMRKLSARKEAKLKKTDNIEEDGEENRHEMQHAEQDQDFRE